MKVMKFGGTSVGSAERMKSVAKLVLNGEKNIVVLSAMSGTTNTLVEIADYLDKHNPIGAGEIINHLEEKYLQTIDDLYSSDSYKEESKKGIDSIFRELRSFLKKNFSTMEEKMILSKGELMSTLLFLNYLREQGVNAKMLPSLEYMRTNADEEPDFPYIQENLNKVFEKVGNADLYITQGYICRNHNGEVDNLQRGGSDYSASLIGAAIKAEEIEIWTDIDGLHDNDPRFVENTKTVHSLHFEEAAELAYFGAKILHPTCILPAKINNIPVRLLNTMDPKAEGTLISNKKEGIGVKAVAAKDSITSIRIRSSRMLLAYGFLRRVFEVFESYKTPIDMITTSEVGVSVTIDNKKHLAEIVNELKKLGSVDIDENMVIICVAGNLDWENAGCESKVLEAFKNIPVRMISYGGSSYNISILIRAEDKVRSLKLLSEKLFG
ncbi:MAG TPA: aspartate kinase [Porphyromonadaceae bacterium]|nr:aspartate kinase [Porphyromonadaceae bacterium]